MMKTGTVAVIAFAAGAATCWLIKPAAPDTSASSATSSGTLPTKSGNERPTDPAEHKRLKSLLSQVAEKNQRVFHGEEKDPTAIPTIDLADYPKLLEALQQRAGLSGLSWDDKAAFGKLLGDWYAADPSRAANWVRSLKNAGDRRELGEVLIAAAVKSDYEGAIRLMQDFSVSDDGVVQVPESLMNTAAKRGAEELLKLCSMSVSKGCTSGYGISYPQDFDFRTALQGFAELEAKGVKSASYPANLLDEWAKRDSEAAFRWFADSKTKSPTGSLSSYFSNLTISASADELASKVSLALSIGGTDERLLNSIGGALGSPVIGGGNSTLVVSEMLAKLPEGIDQTALRAALIKATAWEGKEGASRRDSFLRDLQPDERVALMTAVFGDRKEILWNQAGLDSLKQSLVALGHTAEQAAELVPAVPTTQDGGFGVSASVRFGSGFFIQDEGDEAAEPEDKE